MICIFDTFCKEDRETKFQHFRRKVEFEQKINKRLLEMEICKLLGLVNMVRMCALGQVSIRITKGYTNGISVFYPPLELLPLEIASPKAYGLSLPGICGKVGHM